MNLKVNNAAHVSFQAGDENAARANFSLTQKVLILPEGKRVPVVSDFNSVKNKELLIDSRQQFRKS